MIFDAHSQELGTLDRLPEGSHGLVLGIDEDHESACTLRRLGFNEGANIEVIRHANMSMIRCDGACIALHRQLLRAVCVHCPGGKACCMNRAPNSTN